MCTLLQEVYVYVYSVTGNICIYYVFVTENMEEEPKTKQDASLAGVMMVSLLGGISFMSGLAWSLRTAKQQEELISQSVCIQRQLFKHFLTTLPTSSIYFILLGIW